MRGYTFKLAVLMMFLGLLVGQQATFHELHNLDAIDQDTFRKLTWVMTYGGFYVFSMFVNEFNEILTSVLPVREHEGLIWLLVCSSALVIGGISFTALYPSPHDAGVIAIAVFSSLFVVISVIPLLSKSTVVHESGSRIQSYLTGSEGGVS